MSVKKKKQRKSSKKDPFYKDAKVYGKIGYKTSSDTGWGKYRSKGKGGGDHGIPIGGKDKAPVFKEKPKDPVKKPEKPKYTPDVKPKNPIKKVKP